MPVFTSSVVDNKIEIYKDGILYTTYGPWHYDGDAEKHAERLLENERERYSEVTDQE